ncbi:conserved hypothetical protein [Neospora caninum Liverpool]|uniref:Uncharacterized protein n=1 Tax=Neospora caninum (strain Liverpool) TaxID=572307 RepID=F0V7F2_NEOCL|nr:conserved hypothetical protein [Neospora caninum Liverpool]CBZ49643.1 conserved hypothetical protein [Neospora caninum Liverpool]CEL64227.1 TPA: hypothetical protein BN1204_001330 [Neospora caninum Liverpool]|eukprot:XP_003879678.1 conserved hypothetical protein [Neospora caninum Liverpool]
MRCTWKGGLFNISSPVEPEVFSMSLPLPSKKPESLDDQRISLMPTSLPQRSGSAAAASESWDLLRPAIKPYGILWQNPCARDETVLLPVVNIEHPGQHAGALQHPDETEPAADIPGALDEVRRREYRCNKVRTDKKERKRAFPQRGFWKKQNFLQVKNNTVRLAFAVQGVDLLKLKRLRWGEVRKGNTGWWTDDYQNPKVSGPSK